MTLESLVVPPGFQYQKNTTMGMTMRAGLDEIQEYRRTMIPTVRPTSSTIVGVLLIFVVFFKDSSLTSNFTSTITIKSENDAGSRFARTKAPRNMTIQDWREEVDESCKILVQNEREDSTMARLLKWHIERDALSAISFPTEVSNSTPSHHPKYEYCKNIFIDLGTNIGDTIGYFFDNAIDGCTETCLNAWPDTKLTDDFPRPHLDISKLRIRHLGANVNSMHRWVAQFLRDHYPRVSANSFCVYGMEGNPLFTERLQKLENYIMQAKPRPVQHLHIHTESVITAVDGPTKLYLDKLTIGANFWGSSILKSPDAVNTAKELGGGKLIAAEVEGISLTSLLKRTALAYKPNVMPEEQLGGVIIVKMDVEGAEYQVLKEVAASGVLCELKQKFQTRIVMIVEYHKGSTDPEEQARELEGAEAARKTLVECGVEFEILSPMWVRR